MERETKEFKTTGGHIVIHKTYITGRESNEIQKVLLRDVKMEMRGGNQDITGFQTNNITDLNNKTLELLVVSIDGQKENVLDTILDLPDSEYKEIIKEIDQVTGEKKN